MKYFSLICRRRQRSGGGLHGRHVGTRGRETCADEVSERTVVYTDPAPATTTVYTNR